MHHGTIFGLALLCWGWLAAATTLPGQVGTPMSDADKKAVLEKAKVMQDAFDKGDADTIIANTHPAIYTLGVTKEKFAEVTKASLKLLEGKMKVIRRDWHDLSPLYTGGDDEVCFVPKTSIILIGTTKNQVVGFFIAGRKKGTTDWLFLDGAGLARNPANLYKLFPTLPNGIPLPEYKSEPAP